MPQDCHTSRFPHAPLVAALFLSGSLFTGLLAARQTPSERFDYRVRGDFFLGMAGDAAAMDRAMKLCEETLANDPENAEALAWHGSGLIFLGGQTMRAGDYAKGTPSIARGLREMDDAVAKAPDQIGV